MTETYLYSNLFSNCRIAVSKRKICNGDTLEYENVQPMENRWERGYGSLKEKIMYKKTSFFPTSGVYNLRNFPCHA